MKSRPHLILHAARRTSCLLLTTAQVAIVAHHLTNLSNVNLLRLLHILAIHRHIIQLLQPRQVLQNQLPVVRQASLGLAYRILRQVQHPEVSQAAEVRKLAYVGWYLVFSQIQLPQIGQILKARKRANMVDGENENFEIGQVLQDGDLTEILAPEVELLYRAQLLLGFHGQELPRQPHALSYHHRLLLPQIILPLLRGTAWVRRTLRSRFVKRADRNVLWTVEHDYSAAELCLLRKYKIIIYRHRILKT